MPPPNGILMTIGRRTCPAERKCILATCDTIWSYAGKTNPSNWISQIGRYPRSASPTAVPMMPDSPSGVSMTRSSPKSFCRPSVMRKTPPSLPTSSPMIRTRSLSSIARRRPVLSALPMVRISPMLVPSLERRRVGHEPLALGVHLGGSAGVRVVEDVQRLRVRQGQDAFAQVGRLPRRLLLDLVEEVGAGALRDEVRPDALERVLRLPRLDLPGHAVAGRVVGGGVGAHPVRVRLDQGRSVAVAGVVHGGAGDRVAGEHVVAVDAQAGEAEAGGALVEGDAALPLGGLGDGVLFVLAKEHDGGVVHAGPDERLVDVAL